MQNLSATPYHSRMLVAERSWLSRKVSTSLEVKLFGSGSMTLIVEEGLKVTHVKPRTKVRMSWRPARRKIAMSARF